MSLLPGAKPTCPLRKDPAQCARRQNWTPQPRECRVCDFYGRKAEGEAEPIKPAVAPAIASDIKPAVGNEDRAKIERESNEPKKEEKKVAMTPKENILATITRKQPCVSTPILQCTAVKAAELHQFAKELEAEGKIKIWIDGKKTIYTVVGAPDPRAGEKKTAQSAPTTPPSKSRAKGPRKAATPLVAFAMPRVMAGGNGNRYSAIDAAIVDLERRRAVIDDAINKLREVQA